MRNNYLIPLFCTLALASCVDKTGLSEESSRRAHPDSNPNSAVTIVEYADLQCPACSSTHERVVKPLLSQYGDRIRYDFKHFPLRSIHQYAFVAAEAAECAADQNKFWEYIDIVYENQESLDKSALNTWAEELNSDVELFKRCIKSGIKRRIILNDFEEGKEVGVTGTPSFYVNGEKVSHDLRSLGSAIEKLVAPSMPL